VGFTLLLSVNFSQEVVGLLFVSSPLNEDARIDLAVLVLTR
jgi:hypothetical protein